MESFYALFMNFLLYNTILVSFSHGKWIFCYQENGFACVCLCYCVNFVLMHVEMLCFVAGVFEKKKRDEDYSYNCNDDLNMTII